MYSYTFAKLQGTVPCEEFSPPGGGGGGGSGGGRRASGSRARAVPSSSSDPLCGPQWRPLEAAMTAQGRKSM